MVESGGGRRVVRGEWRAWDGGLGHRVVASGGEWLVMTCGGGWWMVGGWVVAWDGGFVWWVVAGGWVVAWDGGLKWPGMVASTTVYDY